MSLNPVQLPDGRTVVFTHRSVMHWSRPMRADFRAPAGLPKIQLPVDWSKGGSVSYPMDGNDQYGDCMYVAACHIDNTFTAQVGTESTFDLATLISHYKALSGGDNGLNESQITGEWTRGLCGDPNATIIDSLDIDTTDEDLTTAAIYFFGAVFFMLSVPNRWINTNDGDVWDIPAHPNPFNGHGVCWVGVDAQGRKRLITWGGTRWLTQAGVSACDPSGFVVFSKRWFDPASGLAPNGLSYDQLAELWVACGGKAPPANPFPSSLPPTHA